MAKTENGGSTQETTATPNVLVLPVQRSFVGRIMEVSTAAHGGTFSRDTVILTVKNLEEKSAPITVFVSAEFLQADESLAKLKVLFKGNIVDLTVEDHESFVTGFYGKTKDSNGVVTKDTFLTAHEKSTKNFFVNAFETDTVDYRAILRKTLDKEEVTDELELLERRRSVNELKISESIAQAGSSAFGALR